MGYRHNSRWAARTLLSSVLLFSASAVWAQVTVSGRVTDWSGQPLGGVRILVTNETGHTVTGADTRIDGTYTTSAGVGASPHYVVATDRRPNVLPQYWKLADCSSICAQRPAAATPISSTDGRPITGIDFALRSPELTMTFRITAEGEPLAGAGVDVFSSFTGVLLRRSTGVSGSDGIVRITVPAGSYHVRSSNRAGWVEGLANGRTCGFGCVLGGIPTVVSATTAQQIHEVRLQRIGINDVLPGRGSVAGGERITIRGGGFVTGSRVEIDGVAAPVVGFDGDTITAITPPRERAGTVDVIAIRPDGIRAAGRFVYTAACAAPTLYPVRTRLGDVWILRVDVAPVVDIDVQWYRGRRGGAPVAFLQSGREIAVPALDDVVEYTARVTFACGEREVHVLTEPHPARRRATR